jgi:hypothetical protein
MENSAFWPLQNVPLFEVLGSESRAAAGAQLIAFAPLVTTTERQEWENFAKRSVDNKIAKRIFRLENGKEAVIQTGPGGVDEGGESFVAPFYAPLWQQTPLPQDEEFLGNYDLLSNPVIFRAYNSVMKTGHSVVSEVIAKSDANEPPQSILVQPIYSSFDKVQNDIAGLLVAFVSWDNFLSNILLQGDESMEVVVSNTCGDTFTYAMNGQQAIYLGKGDLHTQKYDYLDVSSEFVTLQGEVDPTPQCRYTVRIYPSDLKDVSEHSRKLTYSSLVFGALFLTLILFAVYDRLVQRLHNTILATATKSNAIVSSFFPGKLKAQIMMDAEKTDQYTTQNSMWRGYGVAPKAQIKNFLDDEAGEFTFYTPKIQSSKPIAELFPEVTVMFADIAGFTAWSSLREPTQVFMLLEAVFAAFDELARRRRVFKVETVGDCYVAACGLPDHRSDHATVMARFARDCLNQMNNLTKQLEVTLGPDTADLSIRVGLHSGPVTAGVLRGGRFQHD